MHSSFDVASASPPFLCTVLVGLGTFLGVPSGAGRLRLMGAIDGGPTLATTGGAATGRTLGWGAAGADGNLDGPPSGLPAVGGRLLAKKLFSRLRISSSSVSFLDSRSLASVAAGIVFPSVAWPANQLFARTPDLVEGAGQCGSPDISSHRQFCVLSRSADSQHYCSLPLHSRPLLY